MKNLEIKVAFLLGKSVEKIAGRRCQILDLNQEMARKPMGNHQERWGKDKKCQGNQSKRLEDKNA